jgi:hypothetical protein
MKTVCGGNISFPIAGNAMAAISWHNVCSLTQNHLESLNPLEESKTT